MRAALVEDGVVTNIIEYDPEAEYDPGENIQVVEIGDQHADLGWSYANNTFAAPPTKSLTVSPDMIPADNNTPSVVTYTNTYSDAPTSVNVDINGSVTPVAVTKGIAQLEVVAPTVNQITVMVDDLTATITVTEVSSATS